MNYSLMSLTTAAECDSVAALITKAKSDLVFKQGIIQHRQTGFSENSQAIAAELSGVNAQIPIYQALDASLPEGVSKNTNTVKLEALIHRKFVLTNKQKENGSVALLESEMDFGLNEKQVAELDLLLAAIADRKAAL